jgi:hypothetical protein
MDFSTCFAVGIGTLIVCCAAISAIDAVISFISKLHRTYVLAHCDEFEYKQDFDYDSGWKYRVPFTSRRGLADPHSFTCFTCDEVLKCKHAWDDYNLEGDCLAAK